MAAGARIGTEFAGYRIEAVLGRGGSSVVYRAEYPRLGIPVALKLLNADAAEDESFRERFVRESRLAAAINHPNIITIYDAGVWEETLYIALRFVGGGDLRARLRAGPLDPERTLTIVAQAASGLDAAHARGLVHRDVKPANIMVDAGTADSPEIVYVTDFGLVKRVHSGGRPTPTGDFLGTIDYVAPEQIEGRPIDGRADVYSLACVVFECLTGRPPFERESDAATLWAHMQEEPPRVSSVDSSLPDGLDGVLARALAKDPDRRHQTCGALVAALRATLQGEDARAATTVRRTLPAPRRHRTRLATAVAVAASFGLGAVGAALAVLMLEDDGQDQGRVETPAGERVETRVVTRTVEEGQHAEFLLSSVPEQFRRTCRLTAAVSAEFWTTYTCRPNRGPSFVRYSYARSGPLMGQYFQRRYVRAGLPRPDVGERLPATGTCAAPAPVALEEWDWSGAAGHQLVGQTPYGDTDGRVLCVYAADGKRSRIEWTTNIAGIYGHAEGSSYTALLNWWQDIGGPIQ